tara:strand:- start:5249 stop:9133 length:3885 start_codon:yes stop_codon:yes gene_type:complete
MSDEMKVTKRNGDTEVVSFDKITKRVKRVGENQSIKINYTTLVMKIIEQLYDDIPTSLIDELTAQQLASMSSIHPDYGKLASALVISNLHKKTDVDFVSVMNSIYNFRDVNNEHSPLLSKSFIDSVNENADYLNSILHYQRDYLIDYFGFKTLERAYLMKINNNIVERPQHMWMRVAVSIHGKDKDMVKETYDLLSQKYFTHATPTLFNAGTPRPQLSSCYLIAMEDDSVDGIYNTLKECANISKWAGGIGLHIHNVRGKNSHIRGTNGRSNGIVPMLKVFNNTARYIDQCVVPDTYIYTKDGPIKMENLSKNDYIYNSYGKIEKIDNILEHSYDGEIYNIETVHSILPLKITGEHPVLVLVNENANSCFSLLEKRLEQYEKHNNLMEIFEKNSEMDNELFQWKDVNKLTKNDMFIYRIPEYSEDNSYTWEDCYMYGVLLNSGNLNNSEISAFIKFDNYFNNTNVEVLKFCKDYLDEKLVAYEIIANKNETIIKWNRNINFPFKYSELYSINGEKRLDNSLLNLPINKSKYIIKGLLDSGSYSDSDSDLTYSTGSYNLVESLRFLLLKMGIPSNGVLFPSSGVKESYLVTIPHTKEICDLLNIEFKSKFLDFLTYKNLIFTPIKSIKKEKYKGVLYDLQLKTVHNYMIHNGILHNGGGRRNGSFAIYLEPHHIDIEDFLDLKKNHGDEELRARDLFYALWISDLFMERVRDNEKWYLFCPDSAPGLSESYGDEYKDLYNSYVEKGVYVKEINARDLWIKILDSQMETGTPYILYKDAANKKSNQNNLGVIKSSNLCTEIMEYSDKNETAVCNLASISLPKFVIETESPFTENVKIYTKNDCSWCLLMKALLKRKNIIYEEILVTEDNFSDVKDTLGVDTVPQLLHGDKLIGGYNNVFKILQNSFDYDKLYTITKVITNNLNKIIDVNFYPTEKTKRSNINHRPIGIGVQGLADVFILMDMPYCSDDAKEVNKKIFETIYFAALEKSMEISLDRCEDFRFLIEEYSLGNWTFVDDKDICTKYNIYNVNDASSDTVVEKDRRIQLLLDKLRPTKKEIRMLRDYNLYGAYSSFDTSPAARGILQYDMWNVVPSDRYDWNRLKEMIKKHGLRNSLLVAPMPTASTSQILGNNECFEPITNNIYSRRTLAGEFVLANKYLINELIELDMWGEDVKNNIIANKGSIQYIENIPKVIKEKYKIVWEMTMKDLIDMSKDRGAFICQSQSLNLWVEDPDAKILTNMHFYSWKAGLKTGIYYLRRKPRHQPQQFTIEPKKKDDSNKKVNKNLVCTEEACFMCSG